MSATRAKGKDKNRPNQECLDPANALLVSKRKSDPVLIQLIALRKDREAFAELFTRYEKVGYRVAKHITSDHHLAEEAYLDAMHRIWRSAGSFKFEGNARGWIVRIVARSSLNALQRKTRRGLRQQKDLEQLSDPKHPRNEDTFESEELMVGLKSSLRALPVLDRNIIALRFVGGLSQMEIGKELSLSQRTVSERIRKSLERLRRHLTQAGLAATLSIVSAKNIVKAICEGPSRHPTLLDKALNRILEPDARFNKSALLKLSVVVIFSALALAVFAWQCGYFSSDLANTATGNLEKVNSISDEESNASLYRHWNFNTPGLDDLKVSGGKWKHLPSSGPDGSGCIVNATTSKLSLGIKVSQADLPLEVRFKVRTEKDGFTNRLLRWGKVIPKASVQTGQSKRSLAGRWVQFQCFVTKTEISVWVKDHLYLLAMGKHQESERLTLSVLQGWKIDDLEIRSISNNSLPDITPFNEAVAKISPANRQNFNLLPRLTKPNEPQNFSTVYRVAFHHAEPRIDLESKTQTWRFQKPDERNDFAASTGRCDYIPNGGKNGTGCVEMQGREFRGFFNCNNRSAPFVVTARFCARSSGNKYGFPTLLWANLNKQSVTKTFSFPGFEMNPRQPWVTVRYYVTNRYIDMWVGAQRINFKITSINQFGLPYFYSVYRTQMDFLEIKSMDQKDFPALGRLRGEVDRMFARKNALALPVP